jgi:hypothetical protein
MINCAIIDVHEKGKKKEKILIKSSGDGSLSPFQGPSSYLKALLSVADF